MSRRREALIERFRTRARERLRAIATLLSTGATATGEEWNDHLGAVHTIKGEARMLGRIELAEAVHALEDALHASRGDGDPQQVAGLVTALGVVDRMLSDEAPPATPPGVEAPPARADATATPDDAASLPMNARAFVSSSQLEVARTQVDALCESLEELRARVAHVRSRGAADVPTLGDLLSRVERLADQAWELRLGPVEPMLGALARHAEDLARRQGKRLQALVDAEGAALDRPVLDALAEPLLHLIRNAVDHGLEPVDQRGPKPPTCSLVLAAVVRGADVALEVRDDGRGVDPEEVRRLAVDRGVVERDAAAMLNEDETLDLLFRPGFSTRAQASELSGRGIGLDVVRRVAESLGGGASVSSRKGEGTRFVLTVPVGLTRERVVVLDVHGVLFGVSGRLVHSVERLVGRVEQVPAGRALRTAEGLLPLRSFAELVGYTSSEDEVDALIVDIAERRWAIAVGKIEGERDLLRRPADVALAAFGVASASAVLDDGRPVLLPTLGELLRRRGVSGAIASVKVAPSRPARRRALVVDDSPIIRELVSELLTAGSFAVTSAVDGVAALEALDRQPFDVVVSDLEMPNCDGLELLRRMRARGWPTPFVMVTTRGSAEDRRRASDLGAAGYVVKTDFHEGHLVDVVRRAVGGAA